MTETTLLARAPAALRARYETLLATAGEKPRIREAARLLGVSEAELVNADCGLVATPLVAESPQTVFRELGTLGEVVAISRGDWCVHERTGSYTRIHADGAVGMVLGAEIDLRMFFAHWRFIFSVHEDGRDSIQFFDREGVAIHKVYRTGQTDAAAWQALIERYAQAGERSALPVEAIAPLEEAEDADDPQQLRAQWRALRDVHDFYPMLRELRLSRLGALRAGGSELAQRLDNDVVERLLHAVADEGTPIMVFALNRGIVQIHGGPVQRIERCGKWLNVLDERFQLHLDTSAVAQSWVVNKPTRDGWITSLELYDEDGKLIVLFFGQRSPGNPELRAWREHLVRLCPHPLAA